MSLINKMLRDLDARQATDAVADVPHGVTLLVEPEAPKGNRRGALFALAGFVLLLLAILMSEAWLPVLDEWRWSPTDAGQAQHAAASEALSAAPASGTANEAPAEVASPAQAIVDASFDVQAASLHSPVVVSERVAPVAPSAALTALSRSITLSSNKSNVQEVASAQKIGTGREARGSPGGLKLDTSFSKAMDQLATAPPMAPAVLGVATSSSDSAKPESVKPTSVGKAAGSGVINKTVRDSHGSGAEIGEEAYRKGISAYKQGRTSEAMAQLQSALQEAPRHVAARQTLLSLYLEQKQLDEAQTLLKDGLGLLPSQISWAMIAARIHVERGNSAAAWEVLQRHLEYAGNNADYQGFSGVILQRLKNSRDAIRHYQRALELRPSEGRWWFGLGTALDAESRPAEALDAYHRALTAGALTPEMLAVIERRVK